MMYFKLTVCHEATLQGLALHQSGKERQLINSFQKYTHTNPPPQHPSRACTFACTLKIMSNINPVGIVLHLVWDAQPPARIIILN